MRKRRIAESRKNVIHPSREVIFVEWYRPLMVPKPLVKEKRGLILDLDGLLVHVVESWHGEVLPEWEGELDKFYMEGGRVVLLCRKDSHRFLDWCLQFFHVYVWSTSRGRKVNAILNQVFSQQRGRMAGALS